MEGGDAKTVISKTSPCATPVLIESDTRSDAVSVVIQRNGVEEKLVLFLR